MGMTSARKALEVVANTEVCLGIELLCGLQAIDLVGLAPGKGVAAVHRLVRAQVPFMDQDRFLNPDVEAVCALIRSGAVVAAAEDAVGAL